MRCANYAALAATLYASLASAETHKVLVLKADGNADAATKAKVDAEVQKLARSLPGATIETGEVTFTDAAVAVGCSGGEAQCRDEVLGTMGVDEVVAITVTAMPSGDTRVLVDRIPKSTGIKNATSTVTAGQVLEAKLESDIGPTFGAKAPEPPPVTTPPPPTTTTPPPSTGVVTPAFGEPGGTTTEPTTTPIPNETPTSPPTAEGTSSRGPVIGFAVGGGLVVLSLIMWGEASSTQSDINSAPTKTTTDFQNLQNLESKGETYAALGNVFFIGGLVVAGVSGYFFWRDHRKHASTSAMIAPTLFDHGAGIALGGVLP
ncbi:MAG TPA: hypothetical protein VH143_14565 [Kofleriaceae bacterium]|jgi:hypothetical protein|nr:hypothetical protein [Kofleriaceae bacterium]